MADKEYVLKRDQKRDPHGQPQNRQFNASRLAERSIDELLGLCKGIISDGVVSPEEAAFLARWVDQQRAAIHLWPVNVLASRIDRMLEDGRIDDDERKELFELLGQIAAGGSPQEVASALSTTLPLSTPAPLIIFADRAFCFTGKFFFGTRAACQRAIVERGGALHQNPIQQTDFLVIGTLGSTDWLHSTHGRKIEHAVKLSETGSPIAIVSEEQWTAHL